MLALLAAVVFALIGIRGRGSAVLWAIGGAVFALFTSAIVSGLADATAIPYTDSVRNSHQTVALNISIVIVGAIAALLTAAAGGIFGRLWARRTRLGDSFVVQPRS